MINEDTIAKINNSENQNDGKRDPLPQSDRTSHNDESSPKRMKAINVEECSNINTTTIPMIPIFHSENVAMASSLTSQQEERKIPGMLSKKPWENEEDEKLLELVKKYGCKDWTNISAGIPDRNRKQCRERYKNHLDGQVKKGSWTQEEDNIIFQWQKKVGNKWSVIAQYLPNRTDNAVKNRYWSATRSQQRKARKEAKKRVMQEKLDPKDAEVNDKEEEKPSSSMSSILKTATSEVATEEIKSLDVAPTGVETDASTTASDMNDKKEEEEENDELICKVSV